MRYAEPQLYYERFVFHRTPGFGDSSGTDVISVLRQGGFTGAIDIEGWHGPVCRDELEMTGSEGEIPEIAKQVGRQDRGRQAVMSEQQAFERCQIDAEAYHRRCQTGPCFVCRTVERDPEYPADVVYEDEVVIAFLGR